MTIQQAMKSACALLAELDEVLRQEKLQVTGPFYHHAELQDNDTLRVRIKNTEEGLLSANRQLQEIIRNLSGA